MPMIVFGQSSTDVTVEDVSSVFLSNAGYQGYLSDSENRPLSMIVMVLQTFFTVLGVIFLIIILYAGFRWLTAGGNDEQVGAAKKLIMNSVIGLVIIFLAYIITIAMLVWFTPDVYNANYRSSDGLINGGNITF
ncbi:MAG: pilin [Patescibacteria group bacterium]